MSDASTGDKVDQATAMVLQIAADVRSMGGNGKSFAYSPDRLDQLLPEGIRAQSREFGKLVSGDAELEERAFVALTMACAGDEWAEKEVAGRFRNFMRRLSMLRAIGRHPRRARFGTLVEAIARGRYTTAQWRLAVQLAAEVGGS